MDYEELKDTVVHGLWQLGLRRYHHRACSWKIGILTLPRLSLLKKFT